MYFKGAEGEERIRSILRTLKENPPKRIDPFGVSTITRVDTGEILDAMSGKAVGKVDLPKSDVIVFDLEGGARVVARPSGTEPKVKFYFFLREASPEGRATGTTRSILEGASRLAGVREEFESAFLRLVGTR